jgi:hypothetical protein
MYEKGCSAQNCQLNYPSTSSALSKIFDCFGRLWKEKCIYQIPIHVSVHCTKNTDSFQNIWEIFHGGALFKKGNYCFDFEECISVEIENWKICSCFVIKKPERFFWCKDMHCPWFLHYLWERSWIGGICMMFCV